MDFKKYVPNRLVILYRWLKRSSHELLVKDGPFSLSEWIRGTYGVTKTLLPLTAVVLFGLVIYDFGYFPFYSHNETTYKYIHYLLTFTKVLLIARLLTEWITIKSWKSHTYTFGLIVLTFFLTRMSKTIASSAVAQTSDFIIHKIILYGGIAFLFLTEASDLLKFIYSRRQNPSFVFILSFAVIILAGTLLLMLPNATTHGISIVDAFFTSTSAVCVTGLTVIDTGTAFTSIGKVIILFLVQVGGLGIMTFAGLLGYLTAGSVSFHSQMALKSIVSSNRISSVITMVTRIILVTFFFEAIGAILLYWSVDEGMFATSIDRTFFSVFHAVSAFCNAGFSTESAGLFTESLRFNYPLQIVIALLIILGGMGFPIVFNIFSFIRLKVLRLASKITKNPSHETITRIIHVNSRLALTATFILLIFGFISYFIFEYNGSLKDHHTWIGKVVTSFFGSVTPRTAGFNTVDITQLSMPIIMVYLLLMWIGASPSSTGGGIKTTTAAIAFLNLTSVIHGRERVEAFHTEVSVSSINKAFAVMLLSFLIIGLAVFAISLFDGDKGIFNISFEVFSAFGTVGLSLGITSALSDISKIILVLTMFIGRVGALSILLAFVSQAKEQTYRYPVEEIMS